MQFTKFRGKIWATWKTFGFSGFQSGEKTLENCNNYKTIKLYSHTWTKKSVEEALDYKQSINKNHPVCFFDTADVFVDQPQIAIVGNKQIRLGSWVTYQVTKNESITWKDPNFRDELYTPIIRQFNSLFRSRK